MIFSIKTLTLLRSFIWDKVFKNEPYEICGRQALKNLNQAVFHKFHLVHFEYFVPFESREHFRTFQKISMRQLL